MVKNMPAMQETWVQSLDPEDPLEKGMATHSSILAWRIPKNPTDRGAWWATVPGVAKSWTRRATTTTLCLKSNVRAFLYIVKTFVIKKYFIAGGGGEDGLGVWDWQMQTIIYRINKSLLYGTRKYAISYNKPQWKRI